MEAFDGRVFDGAVPLPCNGLPANRERDPFDLTAPRENSPPDCFLILVAPRMVWLREAMLDTIGLANHVEAHGPRIDCSPVARLLGELNAPRHRA
jgi:hypothetical protein